MSSRLDLDRLKSFVAVGEELHFTRAAQNRLHVSQPWLSRSVKSLEQKLGVQLFERHSRHVELTPSGRRLLYGARKIIYDFDRIVSAVVRERKGNGHLTVGYSPYVDLRFMTELKEMALSESPTVNISFESSSSEETVFHVDHRDWDCGIIILPVDAPHLDIVPLFRLPLAAAMQKTHRLAKRRALRLEDLQNERLILGGKLVLIFSFVAGCSVVFRMLVLHQGSRLRPRVLTKHSIWSHGAPELRWQIRGRSEPPQKESLSGCFLPSLCKHKRRLYFARKGIRL